MPGKRSGDGIDRLADAGLIIDLHDRDEQGVRAEAGGDVVGVDDAAGVGVDEIDIETCLGESVEGLKDGFVFDCRGDDVPAIFSGAVRGQAEQGKVVRFGSAAGQDDLVGRGVYDGSDLRSGVFDRGFGIRAKPVRSTASVAILKGHVAKHQVRYCGLDRCGGGAVKVDRKRRRSAGSGGANAHRLPFYLRTPGDVRFSTNIHRVGDSFEYVFPAIKGIQAGLEFYVSQCPLRLIPRLFLFDDPDLPADVRAQRSLNRQRLPEMAHYVVENRDSYVFSALTASIDAEVAFKPLSGQEAASRIGLLHIPMTARFIINDGQHRRAAIEMALEEDPTLGDETIAVVFFLDLGLERCQQMFADLNRHAVRVSPSLGVLYDHRDLMASLTRAVVAGSSLFRDLVDLERSSLAQRSRKLFTLSAIHTATKVFFAGRDDPSVDDAVAFWEGVAVGFPEWELVRQRRLTGGDVRRDFIHTRGIVLHAIGAVGNALHACGRTDWKQFGTLLGDLDWSLSNSNVWEGRAMVGGSVQKSRQNVTLTVNVIKEHIGLELTPDEQRAESAFMRGRSQRG